MIKFNKKLSSIPLLILISISATSFSASGTVVDQLDFVIDQTEYGPFKRTDNSKELFFTYHYYGKNTYANVQEKVGIKKGLNTYNSYNYTAFAHTIEPNGTYDFSFYFKPSYIDSINGCEISITLYDKENKVNLKVWTCKLSEANEEKYIYRSNLSSTMEHTEYASLIDFTKPSDYITEHFNFSGVPTVFADEYYFELDFSCISFTYRSAYKFVAGDLQLQFKDWYDLFPYLSKNEYGKTIIHIGYRIDGEVVTCMNRNYYVDPTCNTMSEIKYSWYTKTDHFYLPRYSQEKMNSYTYNFVMIHGGKAKVNYSFPVEFVAGRKYFGNCVDSDYCITGGVYND